MPKLAFLLRAKIQKLTIDLNSKSRAIPEPPQMYFAHPHNPTANDVWFSIEQLTYVISFNAELCNSPL
jgi:hypothetical protein